MNDDRVELENLAALISDGKPVNWPQAHATQSGLDTTRTMANLETLDSIIRSHHSLQVGPTGISVWGSLRVIRHLASGSFGEVYRAYDPHLDRDVALKLIHPKLASSPERCLRLLQEGRNLAKVHHKNVATIYGAENYDERVGIWMELIEGDSLADRLTTQGTFSPEEAAVMGTVICRALGAVHAAGQVHGDIKTQNILREVGGRLVLTDFGSGSCLSETDSLISGTPMYLAPEVLLDSPISAGSDIYSLGVLLFHLISGRFPYEAETLDDLRKAHRDNDHLLLNDLCPELSLDLIAIIKQAMAPAAEERYQTVGQLESALQDYLAGEPDPQNQAQPGKRLGLWFSATVLVISAVMMGTGFWNGQADPLAYSVEATMQRRNEMGTVPVVSGATVAPGDRLYLDFEATTDLYVYVLNQDEKGEAFVLFPRLGQDLGNPLAGGRRYQLPGQLNGQPYAWQVTSAGGIEHFLVITSPTALPELEATMAQLATAGGNTGAPEVFRGVGGFVANEQAPAQVPDNLFKQIDEKYNPDGGQQARGIWLKRIDLLNPTSGE